MPEAGARGRRRLAAALLALCLWLAALPAAADSPLLVTVGGTEPGRAVLWVRGFREAPVEVEYGPEGRAPARLALTITREADLTGKAALTDLAPATRYLYRVSQARERVTGSFVSAPAPEQAAPVTFLWSGDLGSTPNYCRHFLDGYPIFRQMTPRRPDFFLFVGDTIYADHRCVGDDRVPGYDFVATDLAGFREKHRYNRADPAVQEFFRGTSVFAIWDDHEVRNDFAGTAEPLMPVGRQAFLDYWPIEPPAAEPTRLYRKFRWGKLLEVFILDTRQYRSPNRDLDGPDKTMLGPVQRGWLVDGVAASGAIWKVIVSSVSLSVPTGRAVRDSWSNASIWGVPEEGKGFAHERDLILRALRDRGVKNLVWVAADVHHAEVIRHAPWRDFVFHELIAGPLSASRGRPRPLDQALNPRALFGLGGIDNFGEVRIDQAGLTVRIIDVTGLVRFTHTIPP
jgi:alkaline phosphatase D